MNTIQHHVGNSSNISKVYNLIILDESGSMEAIKQPTINGFNELIQSIKHLLKDTPEIDQWVSFYSFNGAGIKEHLPLVHASHLTYFTETNYQPNTSTPLYDAIGVAANKLRTAIQDEKDYSVLVTILTDGEENSSKEYSFQAVAALINDLKAKGWVFTYIGANHDVEKTAISLNINNHISFKTTVEDTSEVFRKNVRSRRNFMDKLKTGNTDLQSGFFDGEK